MKTASACMMTMTVAGHLGTIKIKIPEELAASNPNPNPFASPLLPLKVVQSAHKEERASREELLELAAQLQREISVKKECLAASTSCEEVDEDVDKALKRDEPGAEEQREEQSQHDDDEPLLFALCVAIGQPLPPSGRRPPTPGPNWFQNSAESTCRTLHEVHGFATKTVVGLGYDDDAWALNEVEAARLALEEEEEAAAAVGAGRGGRDEAGARTRTRGGSCTSAGSRDEDKPRQQVTFSANWPRNTDEENPRDPVPAAGGGLPHLPPLTRASILHHLEDLYAAATRARRQLGLGQGRSRGKISRPALFLLYVNGHGFAQPAATVSSAKRKAADVYPGDDPFTPYVVPRGDHGAASCRGHPVTPPLPEAPEQIESLSGVDGRREVQTVNVTKNPECFSEPSGLHLDFNGVMEKWLKYRAAKQEHDHEQDVDDRKADRFVWVADICFAGALVDHLRNFHQAHLLQAASAKKRRRTSTAAKIIPGAEGRGRDVVFPLHEELVERDTTSDELGIAVQAVCEASRMSYGHLDRGFYVNELNIFEETTTKEEICRKLQAANLSPRNWFRTSAENLPQFTRWWQMTMRGCHEKADEFFQKKFYAMLREKVIEPGDRESPSWTWADEFATAMQLGEVQVDSWDVPVYFGRSELGRTRMHEGPYHSISRLRRIKEKYFPVVQKYVDAAGKGKKEDGDGGPSGVRKEMLDGWIPRIRSEKLEALLKDAIAEQWRLGIAPGQRNDELRLPRTLPDPEKLQYFHYFHQSVDHDNESDEAAETTSREEASPETVEEVRTLERTFGFGYQLLRSCAVDGYESDFFQKEIEEKWIQAFARSKEWIDRALLAMFPPPGAGLASFGKIGEDSLPEGEPAFRSQVKRDRELLWVGLRTMRARVGESASPLFGSFAGACSSEEDSADEEALAEQARAVREVFDFPVDVDRLNRSDHEQGNTGNRLSLHPDGLTLAQLWLFRYRRSVIEGQRQKEDLKFYAGAGMKVLQSAFMPFAFAYTGANNLNNPMRDTPCPFNSRELAQELNRAANTVKGGTTLSPKAKELARQAAKLIDLGHKMRDQISAALAVDVSRELDETATVLSGGIGEARSRKVREASTLEKTYADNPCVRLSAWLVRHEVPSRMWRHNLRHRLKVLQGDGEVFGGEHMSQADLVERELPTAVGPLNDDLVLKENQEYTNLFFLLRDNVEKPLEEFPTLKWEDFDDWAGEYPELVRKTPWDREYAPPWEWKDGRIPVRRMLETAEAAGQAIASRGKKAGRKRGTTASMEYLAERFRDQGYGDPELRSRLKPPPIVDPTNPVYRQFWPKGEVRDPTLPRGLEFPIDRREAANENYDRTFFIAEEDRLGAPCMPLAEFHSPFTALHLRHHPDKPAKTPEKASRSEIKAAQTLQRSRIEDARVDELFEALQRSALDLLAEGPKYVQGGQLESLRTAIAGIRKERNAEFDKFLWRYEDLLTNMELQKGIVQDFDWDGMLEVLVQRADDVAKKEQKVTDQTVGMVCLQLCRACEEGLKELRGVAGGNKLEGMPSPTEIFSSLEKQKIMEKAAIILEHVNRLSPTEVAPRDPKIDLYLIGMLGLMIERWVDVEEANQLDQVPAEAGANKHGPSSRVGTAASSGAHSQQSSVATNKLSMISTSKPNSPSSTKPGSPNAKREQLLKRREQTSTKYMLLLLDLLESRATQGEHMAVFSVLKVSESPLDPFRPPKDTNPDGLRPKKKSLRTAFVELRDHPDTNPRTVSWSYARYLDPVPKPPQCLADVDSLRFYILEIERNIRGHLYEKEEFPIYYDYELRKAVT
eukprot:g9724.t1